MKTQKIINLFGGVRPMAKILGHKHPTTIQYWIKNGVPKWRYEEIIKAAKRLGIKLTESSFER